MSPLVDGGGGKARVSKAQLGRAAKPARAPVGGWVGRHRTQHPYLDHEKCLVFHCLIRTQSLPVNELTELFSVFSTL